MEVKANKSAAQGLSRVGLYLKFATGLTSAAKFSSSWFTFVNRDYTWMQRRIRGLRMGGGGDGWGLQKTCQNYLSGLYSTNAAPQVCTDATTSWADSLLVLHISSGYSSCFEGFANSGSVEMSPQKVPDS